MSHSAQTTELFEMSAKALLRCALLGFVVMLLVYGVYILAGDFVYRQHGGTFGLSKHELDLIFYCWLALAKLIVILLFLIPWAAIRLVLRSAHIH